MKRATKRSWQKAIKARRYAKERDAAFIKFVKDDDIHAWCSFAKRWNLDIPNDLNVLKAGIFKAVRYCTDIPQEVKDVAYRKCVELGFSPVIEEFESKGGKQ